MGKNFIVICLVLFSLNTLAQPTRDKVIELIEPTTTEGYLVNCIALSQVLINEGGYDNLIIQMEFFKKTLLQSSYDEETLAIAVLARGMYYVGMLSYADTISTSEVDLIGPYKATCEVVYLKQVK